jgi:hypothetical protein
VAGALAALGVLGPRRRAPRADRGRVALRHAGAGAAVADADRRRAADPDADADRTPVDEPTPTPTKIAPTPTPTKAPTPTPTNAPTPTPIVAPTPTPTNAPTPTPTNSPKPTYTPKPTETPDPTCTPKPTATAKPTATPKPYGGGCPKPSRNPNEGCTPGYWRQYHHYDSWRGYEPGDDFATVFGVKAGFRATLGQAVEFSGGGEYALARHAVAALLNTNHWRVDYAYGRDEVIDVVRWAYATGDFETAKDNLAEANEQRCPLD